MKWLSFLAILAVTTAALWYFGVLQAIGGAFDGWMRWIGAR